MISIEGLSSYTCAIIIISITVKTEKLSVHIQLCLDTILWFIEAYFILVLDIAAAGG